MIAHKSNSLRLIGLGLALAFGSNADAKDLCDGNSYRCTNLKSCSINQKIQPCAYGSGGAANSAIIFEHGSFDIEWQDEEFAVITYGENGEHKSNAELFYNKKNSIWLLDNGVVIKFPSSEITHLQ